MSKKIYRSAENMASLEATMPAYIRKQAPAIRKEVKKTTPVLKYYYFDLAQAEGKVDMLSKIDPSKIICIDHIYARQVKLLKAALEKLTQVGAKEVHYRLVSASTKTVDAIVAEFTSHMVIKKAKKPSPRK